MNFPRRWLLLSAAILALGSLPDCLALDPGINTQLSKLKQALHGQNGPDVKRLRAAASSLAQKLPAALAVPAGPDRQDYQLDSAESDLDASGTEAGLTLTDDQRATLINAYQDYADKINALARQSPFTAQTADQISSLVSALDGFLARISQLGSMKPGSPGYLSAVKTLVAQETARGH